MKDNAVDFRIRKSWLAHFDGAGRRRHSAGGHGGFVARRLGVLHRIPIGLHMWRFIPVKFPTEAQDGELAVTGQASQEKIEGSLGELDSLCLHHRAAAIKDKHEVEFAAVRIVDTFRYLVVDDLHHFLRRGWVKCGHHSDRGHNFFAILGLGIGKLGQQHISHLVIDVHTLAPL